MAAGEAQLAVDHRSPCPELLRARDNIDRLFNQTGDENTGLGALNRGLHNSVDWQGRIEKRVDQMYNLVIAATLSGVGSLIVGLILLAVQRGK